MTVSAFNTVTYTQLNNLLTYSNSHRGAFIMVWQIGNAKITRIEELIGPLFDPKQFFPDYSSTVFQKHSDWLYPHHADKQSGRIIASMHSWLIETPHHKLLIDTCIGNDKNRMPYRDWHEMQSPWPKNLAATGVTVDEIDYVLCTHLHVDHVGWNTRLADGQWVPTFPKAKYIFAKTEYEFWKAERDKPEPDTFRAVNNQTFDDSVLPILHLAELVEGQTELIPDSIMITPAPGHTPGSITIDLGSRDKQAIFTGDVCHHPIQVYEPEWNSAFCEIPDLARTTRRAVLEKCVANDALMLPAHFGPSFAGYVREMGDGFRFEFSS
jgi:glyoxylase-like metal-dependent hydrolase (beta-lactamase superfamily II)